MSREKGTVDWFDSDKGYGFIKQTEAGVDSSGSGGSEVFVHISEVEGGDSLPLASGEEVEYTPKMTEKGVQAEDVRRIRERRSGVVNWYDTDKGYGMITPDSDEQDIFVHYSSIVSHREFKRLKEGQQVDYSIGKREDGSPQAVRVLPDDRMPLERFAVLPSFGKKLEQLEDLAQDEDWDYQHHESNRPRPILYNYVHYTFNRLQNEGKIANAVDPDRDQKISCFNTGLVTEYYNPIFAAFHENTKGDTDQPFVLIGFFTEDKYPITLFAERPDVANYFTDPAEVVYDRNKELVKNVHHIVNDRIERFPEGLQDDPQYLASRLETAIARAEERVLRNYKTAIPQFNQGEIQLLLPLCIKDPKKADCALVVGKEGAVYKAYTVLTLDMAYNNARLLTRPDKEWLVP